MHTVNKQEIAHFAKDSARWWDEKGAFAPLHRLNPVRLSYIKEQICRAYSRDNKSFTPFKGLSLLDVGCGGGLICEPMARLGADVTGIDADANGITAAKVHAKQSGLDIRYYCCDTGSLLSNTPPSNPPASGGKERSDRGENVFDVVLALEIVEHVANVDKFVDDCVNLCKPDGIIIFSTLNRTPKSFLLGKLAAEYILRWVPAGTHDWKKFLKPSELARAIRKAGAEVMSLEGFVFDLIKGEFRRDAKDLSVNYFMVARKP